MVGTIIIGASTCITMICGILFFPQIKIGKIKIGSYWLVALIGALCMIIFGKIDLGYLGESLINNSSINPLKILVLFISMTILSIFLDEIGFFRYLASLALKKAGENQFKLFLTLYIVVSVLTIFTSNDIIVLTFTPFICYFSKNAKINPIPYLIAEFVAANTMSMTLIIGNPTNIYIATSYGINFFEYIRVMILPTLASSVVAFFILWLLFRKWLGEKPKKVHNEVKIENKVYLILGLIHLGVCTIVLAVGPYVGLEMWAVSLVSVVSLFVTTLITSLIKKEPTKPLKNCLKRAPWELIPFVLSMFVIILALTQNGVTQIFTNLLGEKGSVFTYGASSFLVANVINNIPMSVLYCPIISPLVGVVQLEAIYATIVGSNLGAFLTPIGALAGIMWTNLLKEYDVKISYLQFVKYGLCVAVPTLIANLVILSLII